MQKDLLELLDILMDNCPDDVRERYVKLREKVQHPRKPEPHTDHVRFYGKEGDVVVVEPPHLTDPKPSYPPGLASRAGRRHT